MRRFSWLRPKAALVNPETAATAAAMAEPPSPLTRVKRGRDADSRNRDHNPRASTGIASARRQRAIFRRRNFGTAENLLVTANSCKQMAAAKKNEATFALSSAGCGITMNGGEWLPV